MTTLTMERPRTWAPGAKSPEAFSLSQQPTGKFIMYAIAFDMDTETLKASYPNESYNNAYGDIKKVLESHGFTRQQGSVYFGDPKTVTAVTCVLAVMDLTRKHDWFAPSVRDIRMLRIEEQNDLMEAVKQAVQG